MYSPLGHHGLPEYGTPDCTVTASCREQRLLPALLEQLAGRYSYSSLLQANPTRGLRGVILIQGLEINFGK